MTITLTERIAQAQEPKHTPKLESFACKIRDHRSCLLVACRCDCHEERR